MKRPMGAALLALALLASETRADLLTKKFQFKSGVILQMGIPTGDGLRLDAVRFTNPAAQGERYTRSSGLLRAEVEITNEKEQSARVGIAIALFDAQGRLLGVASGGNKLGAIKPGTQHAFTLIFEGVNAEAGQATEFQISVEKK